MPRPPIEGLTQFGRDLATAARTETLARFAETVPVDNKAGPGSYDPVTEADRSAELTMRKLIAERFPDHGISGEEFGDTRADSRYCWSLDPIDGTRSFICGLPTWVTLAALLEDGEPKMGLIDAPCLDELYIGLPGAAWMERPGSRIEMKTSGCRTLAEARLSTTDPFLFEGDAAETFEAVRKGTRTVRFGHDGYAYARLAAGSIDLVVECGLKSHDYNALIPVVCGAGGAFGDWSGGANFGAGNVIAAATVELYDATVAIMRNAI